MSKRINAKYKVERRLGTSLWGRAKSPFNKRFERVANVLDLVHTDVYGPFSIMSCEGFHYFITFTDDYSRYGYVHLMRYKSESFERFKEFKAKVENQIGRHIKAFHSDRGGEYMSTEFELFLRE